MGNKLKLSEFIANIDNQLFRKVKLGNNVICCVNRSWFIGEVTLISYRGCNVVVESYDVNNDVREYKYLFVKWNNIINIKDKRGV